MKTSLAVGVTAFLSIVSGIAIWPQQASAAGGAEAAVAKAARAFLDGLQPEQRTLATRPLADAERTAWNFVPGRYAGIELGALAAPQEAAAQDLLRAMLSAGGYAKTTAIVQLENVLRALEGKAGGDVSHRDPARYTLLVFGEPAAEGTFAVRFQGHHVSLHLAIVGGRLAGASPRFLGTNPHELPEGAARGRRVLGAEEDLARALLLLLDADQRRVAVIAEEAPADILLGPGKPPSALGARRGLPWSAMTDVQRGVLWRLLEEHANVLRGEFAAAELARVQGAGLAELSFAWAGGLERGQGHYYRIHGEHFAVEYDNTQNGANHVHTVWRDFEHDFGGDLLKKHLEEQHGRK